MSNGNWYYSTDLDKMSKKELREIVTTIQTDNLYFRKQLEDFPLVTKPVKLKNPLCLSCAHGHTVYVPSSAALWFVGCDKYDCECSDYEPKK